jgi:hypothetical protein
MRAPSGSAIQRRLKAPSLQSGEATSKATRPGCGVSVAVSLNSPVRLSSAG